MNVEEDNNIGVEIRRWMKFRVGKTGRILKITEKGESSINGDYL